MERVENILGIYCGQNGFRLALILPAYVAEKQENGKTSDILSLRVLELLENAGIRAQEINKIVVCVGPGSFTSSRVAVSFTKGFCCGNKSVLVVPFSTFEFLSYGRKCDAVLVPAFSDYVFVEKDGKQDCVKFSDCFSGNIVADDQTFARWGKGTQIQPNQNFIEFVAYKSKEKSVAINDLKPIYLRASQAEIAREAKNGNKN